MSTSIAWSSLTMTSELLNVVIAPVPVANQTPLPRSSKRHAAAPSVGSVSPGSCAAISPTPITITASAAATRGFARLMNVLSMPSIPRFPLPARSASFRHRAAATIRVEGDGSSAAP